MLVFLHWYRFFIVVVTTHFSSKWVVNLVPLEGLLGMQMTFHKQNRSCVFSDSISAAIIIQRQNK